MLTYEAIRKQIERIDGGTFQTLAQRYCFRKYGIKSVNYSGTMPGSAKTVKSPLDAFFESKDGTWAFLEAGHISERNQALRKIQDDIMKCLDYEQAHSEMGKVSLIICCYSCSRLTPNDLDDLKKLDQRIELVSADDIAEGCSTSYPWLAKEYLGIAITPIQLSDLEGFVSSIEDDAFAPSLSIELQGRRRETEELLELLKTSRVVCIDGKSGSGKTRIGVEVCAKYSEVTGCEALVIKAGHQSIYESLACCCSNDVNYLILLDDANEISDLRSIRELVSARKNIRVIATVRNYAKQAVINELKHIDGSSEYTLAPLDDEAVRSILCEQIGITDQNSLQQIVQIAHGNLRLAILAAESLSREGLRSIINIQELLATCYESKLTTFSENEKRAISIAAALGAHETKENPVLSSLEEKCGLNHQSYINACRSLYEKELMDMVQDFAAVSFEEQSIRDYFIFHAFVRDGLFTLGDIWSLPKGSTRIAKIANILLNVFYTPETHDLLRSQVLSIWKNADDQERSRLIEVLGQLIPLEAMMYLETQVANERPAKFRANYLEVGCDRIGHLGFKSETLELLAQFFGNREYWKHAISIALSALIKNNASIEDYCYLFETGLKPNHLCPDYEFRRARYTLDRLQELYETTNDATYAVLFIRISKSILNDTIEGTEAMQGNQFRIFHGTLPFSNSLIQTRKRCIEYLNSLRGDDRFTDLADTVIFEYVGQSLKGTPSLSQRTVECILESYHLSEAPNSYSLACNVWTFMRRNESILSTDNWISALFNSDPVYQLIELSINPRWSPLDTREGFEAQVQAIISSFSIHDWKRFLNLLQQDQSRGITVNKYNLVRIFLWALDDAVDKESAVSNLLIDAIFAFEFGAWECFDTAIHCLEKQYPDDNLRQIIEQKATDGTLPSWLSRYDSYILGKDHDYPEFAANALDSVAKSGETAQFEDVMQTTAIIPGFFGEYCNAITESERISTERKCYIIASIGNQDSNALHSALVHSENLSAVESLILSSLHASRDFWYGEKICPIVVQKDPGFIFDLLTAWIEADVESYFGPDQCIEELYWSIDDPVERLTHLPDLIPLATADWSLKHALTTCIASIVKKGIEKGFADVVIDWLATEATTDALFADIAIEAATSFDYTSRSTFCEVACAKGLSVGKFEIAALSMSFNGESWSGSELPLIDRKLKYIKELDSCLIEKGYLEHSLALKRRISWLEDRRKTIEVQEFLDPFNRN